ncbi:MAG: alpha/beta fold hydrolase [Lachnospiraceae bacterium]|nr:alpha/beta fold hydrolase [Lachnospiraceae bacterium]
MVFYGGNAQSGASAMKVFRRIGNRNLFSDIDIITVDYPGYGRSEGAPSQQSFFEMADAVNRYALSLSEYQKVYVMGYSIGTGVAVYSAASYSFDGIILLAPYDNMTNVFNSKLPVFYGPLARLVKNPFPSDSYASNVKTKTLILYSTKDEIIPARLSRNLIQTIAGDKEVIEFKNFTHSEMIVEKEVYEKVSEFIHK